MRTLLHTLLCWWDLHSDLRALCICVVAEQGQPSMQVAQGLIQPGLKPSKAGNCTEPIALVPQCPPKENFLLRSRPNFTVSTSAHCLSSFHYVPLWRAWLHLSNDLCVGSGRNYWVPSKPCLYKQNFKQYLRNIFTGVEWLDLWCQNKWKIGRESPNLLKWCSFILLWKQMIEWSSKSE